MRTGQIEGPITLDEIESGGSTAEMVVHLDNIVDEHERLAQERERLLGTVEEGALLFNGTIEAINASRYGRRKIPLFSVDEYHDRAERWLTRARVAASLRLLRTDERTPIVFPKIDEYISFDEVLISWFSAVSVDGDPIEDLKEWKSNTNFGYVRSLLRATWSADQLSGYDPQQANADRLVITSIASGYGDYTGRLGSPEVYERWGSSVREQRKNIAERGLAVATIFDGALLARRYRGQKNRTAQEDTYVRAINLGHLAPYGQGGSIIGARAVHGGSHAMIELSAVADRDPAREQVT